jgi:hypothetical protein
MSLFIRLLFILALSVPGLTLAAYSAVNPRLASLAQSERPKKILLLPPQMFVAELSAGGVIQKQDDWTREANENLLGGAETYFRENGQQLEAVRLPKLDAEEAETVESHIGLYDRLAYAIYIYGRGQDSGWQHKKTEWDYTLGDGLAFLREKTGADTALIFTGADIISSSGRKAAFVAGLLLGVVIPTGQSFITVGLADLKTGEIRWMSYDQSMLLDSRNPEAVKELVRDFFKTYPQQ